MGLGETIPSDSGNDDDEHSGSKQRKSLIANTYSSKVLDDRKGIDDWELSEEEVAVAYGVTSPRNGSGAVKQFLGGLRGGDHEEFYSELQVAIAHAIGRNINVPEFQQHGIEAEGQTPLLELFHTDASDVFEYLVEGDDEVLDFESLDADSEAVRQVHESLTALVEEADAEEEAAEAEADD